MPHKKPASYIGRFAPSPTGPIHFGTMVAAVGSYLQARTRNGSWLLRIEDVDITRTVAGADTEMLRTLEHFGFEWDGEVVYQSQRTEYYEQALDRLAAMSLVYPCLCSRKRLSSNPGTVYPGICRRRTLPERDEHSLRILTDDQEIVFTDMVMGDQRQNMQDDCGDFIIRRRDGLFAYQLAVVVDDALQGVTEIVRGADLLDSTPRQIYLQRLLGYDTPVYCHLPVATDAEGNKISKSAGATTVATDDKITVLVNVLRFLGQDPPTTLLEADVEDVWRWAFNHWDHKRIPAITRARFD